jgi:hypothetical protein
MLAACFLLVSNLVHLKMIETNLVKIQRRIAEMWQFQEWSTWSPCSSVHRRHLAYSSTLNMEATCSFCTSVDFTS